MDLGFDIPSTPVYIKGIDLDNTDTQVVSN